MTIKQAQNQPNTGCLVPAISFVGILLGLVLLMVGVGLLIYCFSQGGGAGMFWWAIGLILGGLLWETIIAILLVLIDIETNMRSLAQILKQIEARLESGQDRSS